MKNFIYVFALLVFGFSACSKDNPANDEMVKDTTDEIAKDVYDFLYKGEKYTYSADSKDSTLIKRIQSNQSLATFVHDDGMVEYFDSYQDMMLSTVGNDPKMQSKNVNFSASLELCADQKLNGDVIWEYLSNLKTRIEEPDLISKQWGNKITSLNMVCSVSQYSSHVISVTLYDETYYKGYSLTFNADWAKNTYYVKTFDHYTLYPGGPHWNDKIRSYKFYLR